MKNLITRDEILNFLIDVEISPKLILSYSINTKNSSKNEYLSNELKLLIESYLLDDNFTKNDFNESLQVITKNVTNKF